MQKGQSLIELVLAIGLISILLPALLTGFYSTRNNRANRDQKQLAAGFLDEAAEAIRIVRANAWSNLSQGIYHPVVATDTWSLSPGSEVINSNFTRQIEIDDVRRDSNGDISQNGEIDPSSKLITITVSWNLPFANSISTKSYLTRHEDFIQKHTTLSDFSGTNSDTIVSETGGSSLPNDAQIQLRSGGSGDWCNPNEHIIEDLDLPKNGVANAISAYEGRILVGTGENSSGVSLADVDVTNTNPPVATIKGTFNGYKTNDVFVQGNYGYIGTDTNSKEVVIIDMTSVPYSESGFFNASGVTDTNSVFIAGDIGYITQGNRLRNFNLATCSGGNRTGSCPAIDIDGAAISATGTSVVVSGNYAFVSITGHTRELEIFDISNPSGIVRVGWADVNGEAASDVVVNSNATRAYIVTAASSTLPEFFIINTTNKNCSDCPDVGTYDAGTSVNLKAVEILPGNHAVVIGQGGEEYQVIDISQESNPTKCGGMNVDTGINDNASILEADRDAYSYVVTGDASRELKVIEGTGGFFPNGSYISPIFDATGDVMLNSFTVNHQIPPATTIAYYFGIAKAVGNSCGGASFAYAGPFATSSALPISIGNVDYSNPGRCIRYKIDFSTDDLNQTAVLYDISFNYSL